MGKEELRTELKNFADALINGYVEDTTIIEILGTNDCIDDYVDNELRERWENKPSEKEVLPLYNVIPCYLYDMRITDEGTPFEINDWIPIATDRIKQPERIHEYLEKGLLRKHNKV